MGGVVKRADFVRIHVFWSSFSFIQGNQKHCWPYGMGHFHKWLVWQVVTPAIYGKDLSQLKALIAYACNQRHIIENHMMWFICSCSLNSLHLYSLRQEMDKSTICIYIINISPKILYAGNKRLPFRHLDSIIFVTAILLLLRKMR